MIEPTPCRRRRTALRRGPAARKPGQRLRSLTPLHAVSNNEAPQPGRERPQSPSRGWIDGWPRRLATQAIVADLDAGGNGAVYHVPPDQPIRGGLTARLSREIDMPLHLLDDFRPSDARRPRGACVASWPMRMITCSRASQCRPSFVVKTCASWLPKSLNFRHFVHWEVRKTG
jgi:hypothetical protein